MKRCGIELEGIGGTRSKISEERVRNGRDGASRRVRSEGEIITDKSKGERKTGSQRVTE